MVGKREQIAAALSTVSGVTGYARRPRAPQGGDAWPRWRGGEVDAAAGQFAFEWAAIVQLPGDEQTADVWVDDHLDALWDALTPCGWVVRADPVNLGINDDTPVFGLMITMRSE